MTTKKDNIEILQVETHMDDGVCFSRVGDDVYCSIDYAGGEMKFKLNFIENLLSQQNSYLRSEVEKMKRTAYQTEKLFDGTAEHYNQALSDILKMMSENIGKLPNKEERCKNCQIIENGSIIKVDTNSCCIFCGREVGVRYEIHTNPHKEDVFTNISKDAHEHESKMLKDYYSPLDKAWEERFIDAFDFGPDIRQHTMRGIWAENMIAFFKNELTSATIKAKESMGYCGSLYGADLRLDTQDENVVKKANSWLTYLKNRDLRLTELETEMEMKRLNL